MSKAELDCLNHWTISTLHPRVTALGPAASAVAISRRAQFLRIFRMIVKGPRVKHQDKSFDSYFWGQWKMKAVDSAVWKRWCNSPL